MRLLTKEIRIIKNQADKIFGKNTIYLFGSRVDNNKYGGDIDLYIKSKDTSNLYRKKQKLKILLEDMLYKPVDVVVATNKSRQIEQEATKYGIKL